MRAWERRAYEAMVMMCRVLGEEALDRIEGEMTQPHQSQTRMAWLVASRERLMRGLKELRDE